jgi:hypothetical protein
MRKFLPVMLILALLATAVIYFLKPDIFGKKQHTTKTRTTEDQAGTHYQSFDPALKPTLTELSRTWFHGANSIWGSTGRDDQGHIWFGISGEGSIPAHLVEYDPELNKFVAHGDPVSALKAAGIYRKGEEQIKIHSKIIQMDDGWLYFSSMDETGERSDGSQLPQWGSHFWRYKPSADHWEHLYTAPEGLIAVSGVGRWIYALGYWGHVLYQYDTRTGQARHIRVGSEGGHISRNLVADKNGHVYVPRVKYFNLNNQDGKETTTTDRMLVVTLVEYDQHLNKMQGTPLIHYAAEGKPEASHGITSFSYLADGTIIIGTHVGYLYKITPSSQGPATVTELGWLHPDGESYNPSLFPQDGRRYLTGITQRRGKGYQLIRYDLEQNKSQLIDLDIPLYKNLLLYGSNTRDEKGRGYVVGRYDGNIPIIFQLKF